MKIAIVGAGLSGASVLKTLIDHPKFSDEIQIDVYEPRQQLGVGLPYGVDDESVMLNITPKVLSVDASDPDDFVKWLNENYEQPYNFENLVSRPRYGKYLVDRFERYFSHDQVKHYQNEVVDVEVIDKSTQKPARDNTVGTLVYRLKADNEKWISVLYDAVFFAVGHPSYADYYDLIGQENYIHNPYPMKEQLMGISNDHKVGVIGSGATGVDLMRFFENNYNLKTPLTYYVQNEIFNFVHIPYNKNIEQFTFSNQWIEDQKINNNGMIPFQCILDTYVEDIKSQGVDVKEVYNRYTEDDLDSIRIALESNDQELALVQAYTAKLIEFMPKLFNTLSEEEKKYFMENYQSKLLFFKSHVPNKTFRWLFELLDEGKVKIVKNLSRIDKEDNGLFKVHADEVEMCDYLINATGFDTKIETVIKNRPLMNSLYSKNLILPHRNGRFVFVKWPQLNVINQRFGQMDNLFFLGNLIGGTQYQNNDARLTIKQASFTATQFLDNKA